MRAQIYTVEKVNLKEEPLFFGKHRNTQRFDDNHFDWLSDMALQFQRLMWFP